MTDHIINLVESALIILTVHHSFRKEFPKKDILLSALFLVLSFLLITWINMYSVYESVLAKAADILLHAVYLYLISKLPPFRILMTCMGANALISAINILCAAVAGYLLYGSMDYLSLVRDHYLFMVVLTKVLFLAAGLFTAGIIRKSTILNEQSCMIFCIMLVFADLIISFFEQLVFGNTISSLSVLISSVCILCFCILSVCQILEVSRASERQLRSQFEIEYLQSKIQSDRKLIASQEELNSLRHDMRHYYKALADSGYAELAASLKQRLDRTGLPVMDSDEPYAFIINAVKEEALQKGIDFVCIIALSRQIAADPYDICLILSNLLENAVNHIGSAKHISLEMEEAGGFARIRVSNSIDRPVLGSDGIPVLPGIGSGHGYGVRSIISTAEKNGGYVSFAEADQQLVCTVLLPLKEKQS